MSSVLKSLFEYKAWADDELYELLLSIDENKFPDLLHASIRVLNHAFVVDEIFKCHLILTPHEYQATNTESTPSLKILREKTKDLDMWYLSYASTIDVNCLTEEIEFVFTDGEKGKMKREEILLHVITHGGYHRGQVGQIVRGAAVSPPRDTYTRFLHLGEPYREQKNA